MLHKMGNGLRLAVLGVLASVMAALPRAARGPIEWAAYAGDAKAMEIIEHSAVLVARAVSAVTNTLDVDRVVFGGPFWSCLSQSYLSRIPGLIGDNSATRKIHAIEVVGTGVGDDVGAVGAACLVLEHTLAPRSQRLLLEG